MRRDDGGGCRAGLREEGLDALLISNPVNVTYLTGFSGDSSYLVLGANRSLLVSDARFTTQIAEECPGSRTTSAAQTVTASGH